MLAGVLAGSKADLGSLGLAVVSVSLLAGACSTADSPLSEPLPTVPTPASEFIEADTDVGVSDDTIRIGVLADLSGPTSPTDVAIVDGQKLFWASVNAAGGIAGREVDLVVIDTAGEIEAHRTGYNELAGSDADDVVAIGYSGGTEATRAIASQSLSDGLVVVTGSRHSGNVTLQSVLSPHASLCVEAMNSVAWLDQRVRDQTAAPLRLAILNDGTIDAEDAVAGARLAAADMGLEVVFDDQGVGEAGSSAVDSTNPTGVFVAGSHTFLAQVMEASVGDSIWIGSSQTLDLGANDPSLSDNVVLSGRVNERYFHTWPFPAWGVGSTAGAPDVPPELAATVSPGGRADWQLFGWIEATMLLDAITQAFREGDVSRSSLLEVATTSRFRFGGLATAQTWPGSRADRIARDTYVYDLVGWGTPAPVELIQAGGPDASETAADYVSDGSCGPPPVREPDSEGEPDPVDNSEPESESEAAE